MENINKKCIHFYIFINITKIKNNIGISISDEEKKNCKQNKKFS